MNIKKLKKLKAWILAEPRRYNQKWWIFGKHSNVVQEQKPPCGTAACLAGNACLMEGYVPVPEYLGQERMDWVSLDNGPRIDVGVAAEKILGMKGKGNKLFSADCQGWSEKARQAYLVAKTPQQRADAAAMELDRLIKLNSRKKKVVIKSKSKR